MRKALERVMREGYLQKVNGRTERVCYFCSIVLPPDGVLGVHLESCEGRKALWEPDAAPRPGPSAGETRAQQIERALREVVTNGEWQENFDWRIGADVYHMAQDALADPPVAAPPPPEDHLDIYVPGTLRCPQCEFQVVSQTMFMGSGEIGTTRRQALVEDVGEPCPNDGTPMVKVRWSERAVEAERAHIKLIDDIIALTGKQSLPEALDSLKRDAEVAALPETPRCHRCDVEVQWHEYAGFFICPKCGHRNGSARVGPRPRPENGDANDNT